MSDNKISEFELTEFQESLIEDAESWMTDKEIISTIKYLLSKENRSDAIKELKNYWISELEDDNPLNHIETLQDLLIIAFLLGNITALEGAPSNE